MIICETVIKGLYFFFHIDYLWHMSPWKICSGQTSTSNLCETFPSNNLPTICGGEHPQNICGRLFARNLLKFSNKQKPTENSLNKTFSMTINPAKNL